MRPSEWLERGTGERLLGDEIQVGVAHLQAAHLRLAARAPLAQYGIDLPVVVAEIARVPLGLDMLDHVPVPVELEDAGDVREVDGVFARARALHVPHHRVKRPLHHETGDFPLHCRTGRRRGQQHGGTHRRRMHDMFH